MLIDNESPYLYNLTLKPASNYPFSVLGQFIPKSKQQQLALISSTHLSLLIADPETGKLSTQISQHLFAVINSVDKLRFNDHDVLVFTSDSGNLSIIQYDLKRNEFVSCCQMPMCKNGWNRSYPGEFLAVDSQSRCILVGAMEKKKLLYRVELSADKLELSSPVEYASVARSKQSLLCLSLISLESGLSNPLFVALEYDNEQQVTLLNYYEFDQGMNHVVKHNSKVRTVPNDANYLVPVPGHIGGVLVCGENWIMYDMLGAESIILPLPRRKNQNSIITAHVTHVLKKKSYGFFILLQNDLGDLFRLIIDYDSNRELVRDIEITYFDTIPVCYSLNIFKNGLCFANCVNRSQLLYQFEKLGEERGEDDVRINKSGQAETILLAKEKSLEFKLKGLDNLALIDIVESLSPLTDSILQNDTLVTLSTKSKLKSIIHGTPTTTLVESPLPFKPTNIFTTKISADAVDDEYLVITSTLSFKTLVLSIGEVIEEVADSEFVLDQPTVAVQQVGKSSIVQIYSNGLRHINGKKKVTNWYPPAGITITHATTNNQQVLLGMSNLELVYFETDPDDDQLIEYQDRLEVSSPIRSMCISTQQSSFAVVGFADETISVISLQRQSCLQTKSLQALSSSANSLVMLTHNPSTTLIHIGMDNGVYVRTKIDTFSGKLSDTRIKYLGPKPINLNRLKLSEDITGVLAISSKPWIGYFHQGKYRCTPLLDIDIINGASFKSEDIGGDGIVGIHGDNLVIFSVGKEDSMFDPNQELTITDLNLRYMPRKIIGEEKDRLFVSEVEMGINTPYATNLTKEVKDTVDGEYYEVFGYERGSGCASCVQLIQDGEIKQTLEFVKDQRIVDIVKVQFKKNMYLVVGVTKQNDSNLLYTFKIDKKKNLQYIHKTELNYVPQVMEVFQDRLLVASGNTISLYELGQRQLLRKSLTRIDFVQSIVKASPQPRDRLILADSANSIIFAKFDHEENQFIAIADDVVKRNITAWKQLDYDTVIGGDKYGNLFVSRLDRDHSKQVDQNWTVLKQTARSSFNLNSCVYKLQNLCQFYIPDVITSFQLGSFNLGGEECIIYTGLSGTIGVLIPLISKSEIELLHGLQLEISSYNDEVNIAGKSHAKLGSYYSPAKNVFDGDFVEMYLNLSLDMKLKIAKKLNKSVGEVEKKLNDIRNRSSF
ncbi:RSE1 [Candida metapsilosis]|uniref:RSE1 n=1 Tax=Candida metapsilosis TaxID=273372 RepID=A0A8H7ZCU5_9ASCO|nr:RSE1 [Candida metapsilosis]